uniref:EF-hand domain-containing protein n=1 Tax=Romanomermis culicivorax TaxID=13658 RepID=A0A915HQY6_ROMCU
MYFGQQNVALTDIPEYFTESEVEYVRQTFHLLDKDNDGFLSIDEFRNALSENGHNLSPDEILTLFTSLDLNQAGKIDLDQFLLGILKINYAVELLEETLGGGFDIMDEDEDGLVSWAVLWSFLRLRDWEWDDIQNECMWIQRFMVNGELPEFNKEEFISAQLAKYDIY